MYSINIRRAISSYTITTKPLDNLELNSGSQSKLCIVCSSHHGIYCCPSCFTDYCSVECYKQHNQQCTENFYKLKVRDYIRFDSADSGQNHQFMASGGLPHEENNESIEAIDDKISDGDEELRSCIIEKLSANESSTFADLTQQEQEVICRDITQHKTRYISRLSKESILRKAWYNGGPHRILSELNLPESPPLRWSYPIIILFSNVKTGIEMLPIKHKFPRMKECLIYPIVNIICGYILTLHLFEDGMHCSSKEAVTCFIGVSGLLEASYVPASIHHVIDHLSRKISLINGLLSLNRTRLDGIFSHVEHVIKHPEYICQCILECWMMSEGHQSCQGNVAVDYFNLFSSPIVSKERLSNNLLSRKLYYYLLISMECIDHRNRCVTSSDSFTTAIVRLDQEMNDYRDNYLSMSLE